MNFVNTEGGTANLIAAPLQLAPDIAGFINTVRRVGVGIEVGVGVGIRIGCQGQGQSQG